MAMHSLMTPHATSSYAVHSRAGKPMSIVEFVGEVTRLCQETQSRLFQEVNQEVQKGYQSSHPDFDRLEHGDLAPFYALHIVEAYSDPLHAMIQCSQALMPEQPREDIEAWWKEHFGALDLQASKPLTLRSSEPNDMNLILLQDSRKRWVGVLVHESLEQDWTRLASRQQPFLAQLMRCIQHHGWAKVDSLQVWPFLTQSLPSNLEQESPFFSCSLAETTKDGDFNERLLYSTDLFWSNSSKSSGEIVSYQDFLNLAAIREQEKQLTQSWSESPDLAPSCVSLPKTRLRF